MQVNGKHISWTHLKSLYDAKLSLPERSEGLYLMRKLSKEHINLTSYSMMRVDLAAEVSENIIMVFKMPQNICVLYH